jgi:hypothetical protein
LINLRTELAGLKKYVADHHEAIRGKFPSITAENLASNLKFIEELDRRLTVLSGQDEMRYKDVINYSLHYAELADLFHEDGWRRIPAMSNIEALDQTPKEAGQMVPQYYLMPSVPGRISEPEQRLMLPMWGFFSIRDSIELAAHDVYLFGLTNERHTIDGRKGFRNALPSKVTWHDWLHLGRYGAGNNKHRGRIEPNTKVYKFFHAVDTDITDPTFRDLVERVVFFSMHEQLNNPGFDPEIILNRLNSSRRELGEDLNDRTDGGLGNGLPDSFRSPEMIDAAVSWLRRHLPTVQ